jgi:hypothetical protein
VDRPRGRRGAGRLGRLDPHRLITSAAGPGPAFPGGEAVEGGVGLAEVEHAVDGGPQGAGLGEGDQPGEALRVGLQHSAIAAALSATEAMDDFRHAMREEYVELYRGALSRFTTLPAKGGKALLLGVIGAADTLSQAAAAGRMSRKDAIAALTRIMLGAVKA